MTLNCVGLTQSSIIRIIHRNVGLKCFYLLKFLLLSWVLAYIYILQASVKTHLPWGEIYIILVTLLQIVRKVCQSKKFENRSLIGEDIGVDKSKVPRSLWQTVYVYARKVSTVTFVKLKFVTLYNIYSSFLANVAYYHKVS